MKGRALILAILALALSASSGHARPLSVDVRTDRGDRSIYQPGERLEIKTRVSEDAYLLVYEIDAEGYVHIIYPDRRRSGLVEGGQTLDLPGRDSDYELAVSGPVGEGYIVAIASVDPFEDPPWYLRPRDPDADELGYHGGPSDEENEEEGVTREGRIVGDPFVAIERIRRRVLSDPNERGSFATDYVTYYVHDQVRYPRYLCYDCHRPGQWSWWDGFDPYYTQCSVFDFRVNWSWSWGPAYWYGAVPYYAFVYRNDCPPRYRSSYASGLWHSSWDGWRVWRRRWGPSLRRFKSEPPATFIPPSKYDRDRPAGWRAPRIPPGFARGNANAAPQEPGVRLPDRRGRWGPGRTAQDPGSSADRPRRGDRVEPPRGSDEPRRQAAPARDPRGRRVDPPAWGRDPVPSERPPTEQPRRRAEPEPSPPPPRPAPPPREVRPEPAPKPDPPPARDAPRWGPSRSPRPEKPGG